MQWWLSLRAKYPFKYGVKLTPTQRIIMWVFQMFFIHSTQYHVAASPWRYTLLLPFHQQITSKSRSAWHGNEVILYSLTMHRYVNNKRWCRLPTSRRQWRLSFTLNIRKISCQFNANAADYNVGVPPVLHLWHTISCCCITSEIYLAFLSSNYIEIPLSSTSLRGHSQFPNNAQASQQKVVSSAYLSKAMATTMNSVPVRQIHCPG